MRKITTEIIESFNCYLINEEKAQATVNLLLFVKPFLKEFSANKKA